MQDPKIDSFLSLCKEFKRHNFSLYLTGGTVRDFLLDKELTDMDLVTNATPKEMESFLDNVDTTFSMYGYIKCKYQGNKFDITTLRKEKAYKDSRHPSKIKFVTSLKEDYKRRDFTINAMYLDESFKLYDYCSGKEDLENKIIRFIGKPSKRIKEDPLRILRALRFSLLLDFSIEKKSEEALIKNSFLLEKINKDKIKQEVRKLHDIDKNKVSKLFYKYSIHQYIDVLE